MKIVYVAGPYTANNAWAIEQNVRNAELAGLYVVECDAMPIIPHANTRFFHGLKTPDFWYEGTLELLRRSDAILLFTGYEKSRGAMEEHREAVDLGLQIFYFDLATLTSPDHEAFVTWCRT